MDIMQPPHRDSSLHISSLTVNRNLDARRVAKLWSKVKIIQGVAVCIGLVANVTYIYSKALQPAEIYAFFVDEKVFNKIEAFLFTVGILYFFVWYVYCKLRELCTEDIRAPHVLRNMVRFTRSFSLLKGLLFGSKYEVLLLIESLVMPCQGQGSCSCLWCNLLKKIPLIVFYLLAVPFGLVALLLKLEQMRFATDEKHSQLNGWDFNDCMAFLGFGNQVIQMFAPEDIMLKTVLRFAFTKSSWSYTEEDWLKRQSYQDKLCHMIVKETKETRELNFVQRWVLLLTYDAKDLHMLLVLEDEEP